MPASRNTTSLLQRLWRPAATDGGPDLAVHRLRLICFIATIPAVAGLPAMGVLLLARMAFQAPVSTSWIVDALAVAVAGLAVIEAARAGILARQGAWRGLDGRMIRRAERPRAFWVWVACHATLAAIWLAAAAFLVLGL